MPLISPLSSTTERPRSKLVLSGIDDPEGDIQSTLSASPLRPFIGLGYALNPAPGNRDYRSAGVAVTRQLSKRVMLGLEVDPHGPNAIDGRSSVSLARGERVRGR